MARGAAGTPAREPRSSPRVAHVSGPCHSRKCGPGGFYGFRA
jgi:hypothetical protein